MKIRLYTILLSFLIPLVCYAQQPEDNLPDPVQLARMNVITVGGGVTAASAEEGQVGETGTCTNLGVVGGQTTTYVSKIAATCTGDVTAISIYRDEGTTVTICIFSQADTTITPVADSCRTITVSGTDACHEVSAPGDFAAIPINEGQFIGWYGGGAFNSKNAFSGYGGMAYKTGGDCTTSQCTSCSNDADAATGLIGVITCD